jgi:hypothetical protein
MSADFGSSDRDTLAHERATLDTRRSTAQLQQHRFSSAAMSRTLVSLHLANAFAGVS